MKDVENRQHHFLHSPHLKIPSNPCSAQPIDFPVEVMLLLSELLLKSCCHLLSATREHYRIFTSTYDLRNILLKGSAQEANQHLSSHRSTLHIYWSKQILS